jgi:hypothetical protein
VPEEDDPNDMWGEHTPITNIGEVPLAVYLKVSRAANMVQYLVDKSLPALEEKVDSAIDAAENAQRESYDAKTVATLVQQRVEDVCARVGNLEPLKVNGAKREVRLGAVEDRLKTTSERRWVIWLTILGIVVGGLGSIGAAIWWARGVEAATASEARDREVGDKALIDRIERPLTKDEALTRDELRALRGELEQSRGAAVGEWLLSLPPDKRRAVQRALGGSTTTPR